MLEFAANFEKCGFMEKKVGRNDPCPCGSGKKYKNCHMGQETKKTYTPEGKRKFKAKVLSATDKTASVFQGTPSAPKSPTEAPPIDLLKFKLSKKDYRAEGEEKTVLPFPLPEHEKLEKPTIEHTRPSEPPPEKFDVSSEDFREKKS